MESDLTYAKDNNIRPIVPFAKKFSRNELLSLIEILFVHYISFNCIPP